MSIKIDDKSFQDRTRIYGQLVAKATRQGITDVANEILRLGMYEVPHNIGLLQGSGKVEPGAGEFQQIVGYNKVYAARLHEHPEYRFQKGRKGKYLEDPIKNNLGIFIKFIKEAVTQIR